MLCLGHGVGEAPKGAQTVEKPRRAREGRSPLELSIVPGGVYGGGGQFFRRGFRARFVLSIVLFAETRSKPQRKN